MGNEQVKNDEDKNDEEYNTEAQYEEKKASSLILHHLEYDKGYEKQKEKMRKKYKEDSAQHKKEKEIERERKEAEKEAKRKEEEEEIKRKKAEIERKRKEADEAKMKKIEAEKAERKREEEAEAERKREEAEEVERKRKEEFEKRRKEEIERIRREAEENESKKREIEEMKIKLQKVNDEKRKKRLLDKIQIEEDEKEEKDLINDDITFLKEDAIRDPIFEYLEDVDENALNLWTPEERTKIENKLEELSKRVLLSFDTHEKNHKLIPKTFSKKREVLSKEIIAIGKLTKRMIIEDKKLDKSINIYDEETEKHPLLEILSSYLGEYNITTAIIKDDANKEISDASLQLLFSGMITKTKLEMTYNSDEQMANELLSAEQQRNYFHNNIKNQFSQMTGIPQQDIGIMNPRRGSYGNYKVTVVFYTLDYSEYNKNKFEELLNNYKEIKEFQVGALSEGLYLDPNMLDPSPPDRKYTPFTELRGPPGRRMKYYPPYGWLGYRLKVEGKYQNDNWLSYLPVEGAWWIAYYGIGHPASIYGGKPEVGNILSNGFLKTHSDEFDKDEKIIMNDPEEEENYEKQDYDKNHPERKLKNGVYFTPFIEYAEHYASYLGEGYEYNNKKYSIVFMCRVNPEYIQIRNVINADWICSGTSDEVRPYKILIKEVDESCNPETNYYEQRKRKVEIEE